MKKITEEQYNKDCEKLAELINGDDFEGIYGIPRGGSVLAGKLSTLTGIPIVYEPSNDFVLVVDDLIDSGKTLKKYPNRITAVLYRKSHSPKTNYCVEEINDWIEFYYEDTYTDIRNNVTRILEYIGENPNREGLKETPQRVVKSWNKLFGGYKQDPKQIVKVFDKETYDQMVLLKDIEFYSTCEHHFLPFFGKAHIAYIPCTKVIGISKLARLLEIFARRLQIQERIGEQITEFLMSELDCLGAGCILEAQHFCMTSRGIEKQHSKMVTSSLKGNFLTDTKTRDEFLKLCL